MPLYKSMYDEFLQSPEKLDIQGNAAKLKIPHLILHGTADQTVPVKEAELLHQASPNSKLIILADANHTFGGRHPYPSEQLPEQFVSAAAHILNFLKQDVGRG